MPTYVLLLQLNPDGRRKMLSDPDSVMMAARESESSDAQILGMYAVLGEYDFVGIVSARDNDSAARFSLELGVKAEVHVTTLPAIPIGRFEDTGSDDEGADVESRTLELTAPADD